MIKSIETRWTGHVALKLQEGTNKSLWSEKPEQKKPSGSNMYRCIIFKRLVQGISVTVEGIFTWFRKVKLLAVVDTVMNV